MSDDQLLFPALLVVKDLINLAVSFENYFATGMVDCKAWTRATERNWGVGEVGHLVRDLAVLFVPFPSGQQILPSGMD